MEHNGLGITAHPPSAADSGPVLAAGPPGQGPTRRQFLKLLGGGGIVLLSGGGPLAGGAGARHPTRAKPVTIDAWLSFGADGRVTVFTGKVEVGQGVRTSLAQIVAEQLDVPIEALELVMGDTALTPFDNGTLGSKTIRTMGEQLREVAAAARLALVDRAAAQWAVPAGQLSTRDGRVVDGTGGREATYVALTAGKALIGRLGDSAVAGPAVERRLSGRSIPRLEALDKVTGAARYTADLRPPGLLFGQVVRPPSLDARLESADVAAAERLAGVVTVLRDGDFLGVVAEQPHVAAQAAALITTRWRERRQPSQGELTALLQGRSGSLCGPALARRMTGCRVLAERGSPASGFAAAAAILSRRYQTAYIAHAALEPHAAVALWQGDSLTVWTCTQRPFGVQANLARRFNLAKTSVRVVVPVTGAAYGGKHKAEPALEAARLARALQRPVQVAWTREEVFREGYFRPAALVEIKSAVAAGGRLRAWEFHNYNGGSRGAVAPYDVPDMLTAYHERAGPLRQGSYRSLANCANSFARESHVDEIAESVGADPIEFRLRHIGDRRLRSVVEAAAREFGWSGVRRGTPPARAAAPGVAGQAARGTGFACGIDAGSYVAEIAEVEVDRRSGEVKVTRVVAAFDCGTVVNPAGLRQQIEGAIIQGIGGALWEHIRFESGRILTTAFSAYRMPRFGDVPPIDVVVVQSDAPSSGAGEPPIIAIAPAIANAVFDATGARVRELPMTAETILAAMA